MRQLAHHPILLAEQFATRFLLSRIGTHFVERAAVDAEQTLHDWGEVLAAAETAADCDRLEKDELPKVPEPLRARVLELLLACRARIRGKSNGGAAGVDGQTIEALTASALPAQASHDFR